MQYKNSFVNPSLPGLFPFFIELTAFQRSCKDNFPSHRPFLQEINVEYLPEIDNRDIPFQSLQRFFCTDFCKTALVRTM